MTRPPVRLTVEWSVPSGQGSGIVSALYRVMLDTRRQPGCLRCLLSTRAGEPMRLRYLESWEAEEPLRHHVRSEQFARLARLVESATEAPHIEFVLPKGRRGLDYALEARGGVVSCEF